MRVKISLALALLGLASVLCLKGMALAGEKLQRKEAGA